MKAAERGGELRLRVAAPPVASVLAEAAAAVVSGLTAGVAAAHTPRFTLARRAAGVNVALPANGAEWC